jgi:hydrogenase maturation protease
MKTLIIGYGNPLRGDDGAGWHAVERLRDALGDREDVELQALHQLTPELAETLAHFDRAIFIDAGVPDENAPPGTLTHRTLTPAGVAATTLHHFTPEKLLRWTGDLYGAEPEAVLFVVTGERFAFEETLSPPVEDAIVSLVSRISDLLRES